MSSASKGRFVLLRGIENGNRFFTEAADDTVLLDQTKLDDGTIAYEIIGYADSVDDAQMKLYGRTFPL